MHFKLDGHTAVINSKFNGRYCVSAVSRRVNSAPVQSRELTDADYEVLGGRDKVGEVATAAFLHGISAFITLCDLCLLWADDISLVFSFIMAFSSFPTYLVLLADFGDDKNGETKVSHITMTFLNVAIVLLGMIVRMCMEF